MKKDKRPWLSDIIPDEKYHKEIEKGLLEGKNWLGPDGVFSTLLQSVVDASLEGEMDHHIAEEKAKGLKNRRNGKGKKKIKSLAGELKISPPRDRNGTFEPVIVEKSKNAITYLKGRNIYPSACSIRNRLQLPPNKIQAITKLDLLSTQK